MRAQVHPIFPETVAEYNDIGVDQDKLQNLYEKQEWDNTNSQDNPDNFLKISKNLQVLDEDDAIKRIFVDIVNEYAAKVMLYKNKFYMTTSWFTKTEKSKLSVLHNHGNSVLSAVYYFGITNDQKSRITFEKPFLSQFDLKPTAYNDFNGISYGFEMDNDGMLIFHSHLKHKVFRHENRDVRKSLAMNFMPKGIIGENLTEIDLGDPEGTPTK